MKEADLGRSELERLLDKGDVAKDLGVEFVELKPERVVATMPIDRRHLQPFGYLHGGSASCWPSRWPASVPS